MAVDAEIPLEVKPVQIQTPLKALSDLYTMQHQKAQLEGQRLENTARQQENDARTRAAADDAAIRQELQNNTGADGTIDYQGAVNSLARNGHGPASIKLADDFSKRQQQHAAQQENEIKRHMADLELGQQILSGVNDDTTWQVAKKHLMSQRDLAPDAAKLVSQMPDDYTSAKPQIDALVSEGTKMSDRLREAHESLRDHLDAVRYGIVAPDKSKGEMEPPELTEKKAKAEELQTSSVGRMLATARNDQEYQQMLKSFKSQNYSDKILSKFDPTFSPAAVTKAKQLTMSEERYEELGIQRDREQRLKGEEDKGNKEKLHSADMAEYNAARSEYDRSQPRPGTIIIDPTTKKATTATREPYPSFDQWRQFTKGRDADGNDVDKSQVPDPFQKKPNLNPAPAAPAAPVPAAAGAPAAGAPTPPSAQRPAVAPPVPVPPPVAPRPAPTPAPAPPAPAPAPAAAPTPAPAQQAPLPPSKLPPTRPPKPGEVQIRLPSGNIATFPSQSALDKWAKDHGLTVKSSKE